MIPLRDVGPRIRGTPRLTWVLVFANAAAFLAGFGQGAAERDLIAFRYGAVPANVLGREPVAWAVTRLPVGTRFGWFYEHAIEVVPARLSEEDRAAWAIRAWERQGHRVRGLALLEPSLPAWATLLTCMFLHGGWAHLLGNMVFLLAFGARLEDRLGAYRFGVFYLLTGIAATFSHVISDPGSAVPMVGASGAISGVLGGYALLWPRGRILTLIPVLGFPSLMELPALAFVAIWVLLQAFMIAGPATAGGGGVAVWAHLGGFVYGLLLVRWFDPWRTRTPPAVLEGRVRRPQGPWADPWR